MATIGLTVTLDHSIPGSAYSVHTGAVVAPTGSPPATTTVAADVATLVADGASPTQGHVNTLNTDWGTFLTAFNAYAGSAGALSANVTLIFDASAVTNMNQMRAALRALEHLCAGRLAAA